MTKIKTVLLLLFVLPGIFLAGCNEKKTDEELIKEQIKILQKAIETHDRGDFMAVIDEQYSDKLNANRSALQKRLMLFFYRYKDISVYVSGTEIELHQIRAEASSQVILTGGKSIIPDNARHYRVKSCWKKVSDEWLLSCLDWH